MDAQLLKEGATKTNDVAGNGTTAATLCLRTATGQGRSGQRQSTQRVLDWCPFEYCTVASVANGKKQVTGTVRFEPLPNGETHLCAAGAAGRGHRGCTPPSPDGGQILTASNDGTARLWDSAGRPVAVLEGHTGPVWNATFNADGSQILTASLDGTARLWDSSG